MPRVVTEIVVEAPIERAWEVLTDFPRYGEWNPVIRAVEGEARVGADLRLLLRVGARRSLRADAVVVRSEPAEELAWRGGTPAARWFADVVHWFRLERVGDRETRLVHGEDFRGLALVLLWPVLSLFVKPRYPLANEAFKTRCESSPSGSTAVSEF